MIKHRRILAWQVAMELVKQVYRITASFPPHERFALTQQLRRAAVAVPSNIAEGQAKFGPKEAAHGASIALGSLAEVDTLIAVADQQGYVPGADLALLDKIQLRVAKLLLALQRGLRAVA
jgi:four helix bundle protein